MGPPLVDPVPPDGPPLVDPEPLCPTSLGASNVPKATTTTPNLIVVIKGPPLKPLSQTREKSLLSAAVQQSETYQSCVTCFASR